MRRNARTSTSDDRDRSYFRLHARILMVLEIRSQPSGRAERNLGRFPPLPEAVSVAKNRNHPTY